MLLAFSHLQKDDSLVPLLPYATGCFLASILLTISGIAETHPQALALATYLIQFGWLLLQIQGVMLVYTFGSHGQGLTLFKVWLVSMQLLDVHRRFLSSYLAMLAGLSDSSAGGVDGDNGQGMNGTIVFGSLGAGARSGQGGAATFGGTMIGQHQQQQQAKLGEIQPEPLRDVMAAVWGYYTGMLCTVAPTLCDLITSSQPSTLSVSSFLSTLRGRGASASTTSTPSPSSYSTHNKQPLPTGGGGGMKEMENLVLFEVVAGLGVSVLMCGVWATMAIRRGGTVAIPGFRRTRARVQRWAKTIKGLSEDWKVVLEAKVDALVDRMKLRIDS